MVQSTPNNEATHAVEFLKNILKIHSISGDEAELGQFLGSFLLEHGFQLVDSQIGNIIGVKGSGSPVVLLSSHMDTVPTNNPFREEGSVIYATGAVDCKASLGSMMYAAATYPWDESSGTLILACLVHEEDDDSGIEEFLRLGFKPDFAIFGEPTISDRICIGYRGRVWTRLTVQTEHGHTAAVWEFENAIDIFFALYQEISQKINELNLIHIKSPENDSLPHFNELSVVLPNIHAGFESNVLPGKCVGDIDFRIPVWIEPDELVRMINSIMKDFKQKHQSLWKKPVQIKLEIISRTKPCLVGSDTPLVQALRWSIFKETGRKVTILRKTGTTYTNQLLEFYEKINPQFLAITYGPGDPKLEHTDHEHIHISEYLESIGIYHRFFPKLKELIIKNAEKTKSTQLLERSADCPVQEIEKMNS
jgi:LysW-gamma-L-lysine carboxypeptidase